MKIKSTTFSEQQHSYSAPEIIVVDMVADNILCFSNENLVEDDVNPWA